MVDMIRIAQVGDIAECVALSYTKRRQYELAQPVFWKYAGPQAETTQAQWFAELLAREDHIFLVAQGDAAIAGFAIGRLLKAPEVYDPGGSTLIIDDFCVRDDSWREVGDGLLAEISARARDKGAVQSVVVCGAHDASKKAFLTDAGMRVASYWYTMPI